MKECLFPFPKLARTKPQDRCLAMKQFFCCGLTMVLKCQQ